MSKIKAPEEEYKPDARLIDERGVTPERKVKAGGHIFRDDKGREHVRDSPINIALSRHVISGRQYTAATKFYNHWYRAGLLEHFGSSDMNRIFGAGDVSDEQAERFAFHSKRHREAIRAIGTLRSWVVEQVICQERPFAECGFDLGHKNRTRAAACITILLRQALDILCQEWGILE